MSLTPGARLGPYEITAQIGVGGMGEVYRATDTNLARQVAIKVLPESMAADAERLARFDREAKTLAALNHPNIAAIYGLERSDVRTALVIELVEGPTLADRIAHGAIPVDETLAIAKQIAEALEAAHAQGIVHRDLKPANIKVKTDGTVKVLDFGLAKALEAPDEPVARLDLTASPTLASARLTMAGVILGTAAYMAPEQAKGRAVGRTADIWAFGCVLYEMLTGRAAFEGDDVTELVAAVVRAEPDWTRLPDATPAMLRALLRHCLDKDPRRRWQDAASLRIGIEDAMATPAENAAVVRGRQPAKWSLPVIAGMTALASAAIAALAVWNLRPEPPTAVVNRVLINVSPAREVARALSFPNARPFRNAIALSPDGQTLVFAGTPNEAPGDTPRAPRRLYRRAMDRLEATPIEGTEGAESPFFSPDGQWVGFWRGEATGLGDLRKVPLDGGPSVTLARLPLPGGISWGAHGRIVFATHVGGGLWHVPDSGGTPEELTVADANKGDFGHRLPHVLPDGKAVLFTVKKSPNQWEDSQVVVRSLVTGEQTLLVDRAADARYVASGHLVYARMGTLLAQPFDLRGLAVTGEAIAVVDNVMQDVNTRFVIGNSGATQFSVSAAGTLAYLPGGVSPPGTYVPVWMDRRGQEQSIDVPRLVGPGPRVSPEGTRIAFSSMTGPGELAVFEVERGTFSVLAPGSLPVWHPDGQRLAYTGPRGNLLSIAADGSGAPQELTHFDDEAVAGRRVQFASSWSPDGKTLAFDQQDRLAGIINRDIWMMSSEGATPSVRAFAATSADESQTVFSPNGRYVAYTSNLSGRQEVYVQPYPGPGKREVISANGGTQPVWTGRELLYWETGTMTKLMAVDVAFDPAFRAGRPRVVLEWMTSRYPPGAGPRAFDVTPDGKRFLMIQQRDDASQPPMTHIVLVQNWFEELKRRVRAR